MATRLISSIAWASSRRVAACNHTARRCERASRSQETADGFELQFGTNHLGHFALTLPLLPMRLQTAGSRVVKVSSSTPNFGKLDLDDLHWEHC